MPNEFETAVSDEVLNPISLQIGENLTSLKKLIKVTSVRETDCIRITARHENRQSAIIIANAVAEGYVEYKKKHHHLRSQKALEALVKELLKQEQLVNESTGRQKDEAQKLLKLMREKQVEARSALATSSYPATIHQRAE